MIEELLMRIAELVPQIPGGTTIHGEALPLSYICSGAGAFILGKFTGSIGSLTVPLNCSALFIGAITANWLLAGLDLPMDQSLDQPLLVSLLGMVVSALFMMWWFRAEGAHKI